MNAPRFPVPVLGDEAYRRSYFYDESEVNPQLLRQYVELLRQLAPRRYRALKKRTPRQCFLALYEELAERFPLNGEMTYEEVKAGSDECFDWGIPFAVFGYDLYDDYGNGEQWESPATALTMLFALWVFERPHTSSHREPDIYECLQPYPVREWLQEVPPEIERSLHTGQYLYAPKSRTWRQPWDCLYDLYVRVTGNSDNPFVDLSYATQADTNSYPAFNLDEVRGLEHAWRDAKRILDRAARLADYVDAAPGERLPVLLRALRLDPATLQQLSRPRRQPTLAQVFTRRQR